MFRIRDSNREKMKFILENRSRQVLSRFGGAAKSGLSDDHVISIMNDVASYWKDVYRPAMTSLSCEAVGGDASVVGDAGLLITLFSAGIGIHDDLIDKSETSHFRRTILGRHGYDNALLIGDLLIIKGLTNALVYLQKNFSQEKKDAVIVAIEEFFVQIYEGALMDFSCRKKLDTAVELYEKIIWKLTSDGELCARVGAILGGGSEGEVRALSDFGRRFGFIHHLSEEVKDSLNEEGALPHRLEFESVPLPILYAAKSSNARFEEIKTILQKPTYDAHISDLLKLCLNARAYAYTFDLAKKNADQAIKSLALIKPSPARDVLRLMVKVPLSYLRYAHNFEDRYMRSSR